MPITAKLSRKFYDRFGDDIANELVDWLNKVDDSFRNELRELNEINFARFDASLQQRLAEHGGNLRTEIAALRGESTELGSSLRAEMFKMDSSLRAEMVSVGSSLRVELHQGLAATKADLMRWMFGLWATQMAAVVGLILAAILRGP